MSNNFPQQIWGIHVFAKERESAASNFARNKPPKSSLAAVTIRMSREDAVGTAKANPLGAEKTV